MFRHLKCGYNLCIPPSCYFPSVTQSHIRFTCLSIHDVSDQESSVKHIEFDVYRKACITVSWKYIFYPIAHRMSHAHCATFQAHCASIGVTQVLTQFILRQCWQRVCRGPQSICLFAITNRRSKVVHRNEHRHTHIVLFYSSRHGRL